jgi:hypothetical protein
MKTLIWSLSALLALGWTGVVWVTHRVSAWLLGAVESGTLKDAGTTVAGLPLPPLPGWIAPWFDPAWLADWQAFGASLLGWLGDVLPSGDALMVWIGPLLWIGWGLGLITLLVLAALAHWLAGRGHSLTQALQGNRA